jgi:hypothetical protein
VDKADLEAKATKCFDSFDAYWRKLCAFREDYLFFGMYMKRNSMSDVEFLPSVYLKSFQSVINDYPKTEDGLERAFSVFTIARQIILDLQEWNKPVYEESERNAILKELVNHEWVDIDLFCNDFIGCSSAHSEIRQKIDDIIKE